MMINYVVVVKKSLAKPGKHMRETAERIKWIWENLVY
jgi:hypothetical protein